jgi:N-hydroxyarylamine O-acetyltransferase
MSFHLTDYLERIGHDPLPVSLEGLTALQLAQMRAIPFENLAPFLGQIPSLDPDPLWAKLVPARRGGYCLELNLLFEAALTMLGYKSRRILGRVRMGRDSGGPRAHLAHLVSIGGETFLADTGFGGPGPAAPLSIHSTEPVVTGLGTFRVRSDEATGEEVLERQTPDGWFALYGWDETPVSWADMVEANHLCATNEASPFPAHLMLNIIRDGSRASLFDLRLTEGASQRPLQSSENLHEVLTRVFRLSVGTEVAGALWTKLMAKASVAEAA